MASVIHKEPVPPAHPLWDGIYDFAWRITNARAFISCSLAMSLIAFCAWGFHFILSGEADISEADVMAPGWEAAVMAHMRILWMFAVITYLSSFFPCACFVRIIESTSAGDDLIHGYQGVWTEFFKELIFLAWILAWSVGPPAIVLAIASKAAPLPFFLSVIIMAGGVLLLFPFFLLSTMLGNAWWMLVHYRVIIKFLERPLVPLVLYSNTIFFAIPCVLLGYWMVTAHFWWFPLTGIVWATYWMVYARLLGRVGWILTEEKWPGQKRKNRPKVDEE